MTRNAKIWMLMVAAVGIHVADEATSGFLPFYNAQVLALRENLGFFPAPTFSFPIWLGGLIGAVVLGFALTGLVGKGGRRIRVVCAVLSALMIANACGHILGSVYAGRILPGFWSSPWLFVMSAWMFSRTLTGANWKKTAAEPVRPKTI